MNQLSLCVYVLPVNLLSLFVFSYREWRKIIKKRFFFVLFMWRLCNQLWMLWCEKENVGIRLWKTKKPFDRVRGNVKTSVDTWWYFILALIFLVWYTRGIWSWEKLILEKWKSCLWRVQQTEFPIATFCHSKREFDCEWFQDIMRGLDGGGEVWGFCNFSTV